MEYAHHEMRDPFYWAAHQKCCNCRFLPLLVENMVQCVLIISRTTIALAALREFMKLLRPDKREEKIIRFGK